ncbi:MAG TPA: zf-HC2 domain-containing protein [Anaeromyxobacter sp.]|nr:zf-HC2 domain-containing protein [Anaeromyxobacter sp.]
MSPRHPADDLTAFVDGALPPARAAEVRAHLERCAACRAEQERLASAAAAFRRVPPAPVPSPLFSERLAARLAREERPRRPWAARLAAWVEPSSLRWRLAVPAAAAALAGGVIFAAVRMHGAEEAAAAEHLDLLLHYEEVASVGDVASPEDAAVIAQLDEIAPREGRP